MNNEIAQNVNNFASMPKNDSHVAMQKINTQISQCNVKDCAIDMQNSMNFLGNINRAGIHNTISDSVASFLADSEHVQHYNDMYDSLIGRGYDAKQALDTCDNIMLVLKDGNTYLD